MVSSIFNSLSYFLWCYSEFSRHCSHQQPLERNSTLHFVCQVTIQEEELKIIHCPVWKPNPQLSRLPSIVNVPLPHDALYYKSFMLYPADSRVGRGNLVLRHSTPHFLPNSGGFEWQNSMPRFASTPERRNGNIN